VRPWIQTPVPQKKKKKRWDADWHWGIHLSLAMPRKDSTALNIELALDESLTCLPRSLCNSDSFHQGSGENFVSLGS
jgi:hypothetical protein